MRFVTDTPDAYKFLNAHSRWGLEKVAGKYRIALYLDQGETSPDFPVCGEGESLKNAVLSLQTALSCEMVGLDAFFPDEPTSTCPVCGASFRLHGSEVTLLPLCGCLDSDGDVHALPCRSCAEKHVHACPHVRNLPYRPT